MLASELITRQTPPWRAQGSQLLPSGNQAPFFSETLGPDTAPVAAVFSGKAFGHLFNLWRSRGRD